MNDFHLINKSHGGAEGDLVLRWVAEFLEKSVRAHDVCCHVEADKFAVILPDMGRASCQFLVRRLRDKIATLSVRAPFSFGLSMGTASYPEQGTTFDVLVRVAEESRMEDKRAKETGSEVPGDRSGGEPGDHASRTPGVRRPTDS